MQSRRSAVLNRVWIFAVFVFAASAASAQTVGVSPRIAGPINSANRVVIPGNVHPYARPSYDRGLVADNLPMAHMLLVLKRTREQGASLNALLLQQQDPSSPQYHHWLTPAQFGRLYGPPDADITAITDWLASQGFTVHAVSPGRTVVDFSGTAGQVRAAFGTQIHRYVVNGQEHWANASDPQIPAALAPVVAGINSLHNFPLRPLHRFIGTFSKSRTTGDVKPLTPSFAFPGCGASCNALGPYDFATIYNILPLWNAGIDGTGQVIAIAQNTNINVQDVDSFRTMFGLPANDPRVIVNGADPGITDSGAESEADLDVQWAGAVAKNAAVDLVVSASGATDGVILSAQYIVDNNFASIMSLSFGQCELFLGAAGNQQINQLWQQAAAEGITVLVAAGDQGSATCDGPNAAFAVTGLAVNGLASTPFNIAVGGTSFNDIANPAQYWNSSNTSTTQASAKGYIPESTWNDSCTNAQLVLFGFSANGEANCNDSKAQQEGLLTVTGGGGGASSCIAPTGTSPTNCAGAYPKPVWQAGPGVPNDAARDLPDVSLFSGGRLGTTFYVVCQSDLDPSGASCNLNSPFLDFQAFVGTSASTPAFAGMMAMVDQKTDSRQGNANPALYKLAVGLGASCASTAPAGSCIFYDVTLGTNAMPCLKGSPACTVSDSADTYGVLTGYAATANYDLASGLGSVNAANLVNGWSSSGSNSGAAGFQLESSSVTIAIPAIGQSSSATLTVTGFGGFSGTVNLACSVSPVIGTEAPTCAFSPSEVALDNATSSGTAILQIGTTAAQANSFVPGNDRSKPVLLGTMVALICLSSLFVYEQRRSRAAVLAGVALILLLGATAGCSGGGKNPASATSVTNIGTPAGNYVVAISATSGNLKQTTNVFVTIP